MNYIGELTSELVGPVCLFQAFSVYIQSSVKVVTWPMKGTNIHEINRKQSSGNKHHDVIYASGGIIIIIMFLYSREFTKI